MSLKSNLNMLYTIYYSKKKWHNVSIYCDGKPEHHVLTVPYRKYRRGKNRCIGCGAKLGKVKCERYSYRDKLVEGIFAQSPLIEMLKKRGAIK